MAVRVCRRGENPIMVRLLANRSGQIAQRTGSVNGVASGSSGRRGMNQLHRQVQAGILATFLDPCGKQPYLDAVCEPFCLR